MDISLNQVNGVSAGKIINQYLEVLPGSRQLILVVKAFLSQRSMNEVYTGGLGSYAVICLVISFLQVRLLLEPRTMLIVSSQVHPKLRRSEMNPEENLGTLLIEFFELYGRNFNYDDVGISIRRGGFYYSKASRGWKRAGQTYLLSIEDPQDRGKPVLSYRTELTWGKTMTYPAARSGFGGSRGRWQGRMSCFRGSCSSEQSRL